MKFCELFSEYLIYAEVFKTKDSNRPAHFKFWTKLIGDMSVCSYI